MPNIPGSDFAASIINGATAVSAGVVGDLTGFTGAVTNRTNPIRSADPAVGPAVFVVVAEAVPARALVPVRDVLVLVLVVVGNLDNTL